MLGRLFTFVRGQLAAVGSEIAQYRPVLNFSAGPAPLSPLREVEPLSPADHWLRATGAISAAIAGLDHVQHFQAAAAFQIDAADYALQHLMEELAAVMPIPADGAPLRAILAEAARPVAAGKALAA